MGLRGAEVGVQRAHSELTRRLKSAVSRPTRSIRFFSDPDDGVERAPLAPEAGAEPVALIGDLYRLGSHDPSCGDATDAAILSRRRAQARSRALDVARCRASATVRTPGWS